MLNWIFLPCDAVGLSSAANSNLQKSISHKLKSMLIPSIYFSSAFIVSQVWCFQNLPNYKKFLGSRYKWENTDLEKGHFDLTGVAD